MGKWKCLVQFVEIHVRSMLCGVYFADEEENADSYPPSHKLLLMTMTADCMWEILYFSFALTVLNIVVSKMKILTLSLIWIGMHPLFCLCWIPWLTFWYSLWFGLLQQYFTYHCLYKVCKVWKFVGPYLRKWL